MIYKRYFPAVRPIETKNDRATPMPTNSPVYQRGTILVLSLYKQLELSISQMIDRSLA